MQGTSQTGAPATYYLVAQMRQHQLVPLDPSLASQLRLVLLQQANAAATIGFKALLARASVWIDPRYGSWSKAQQQILAPKAVACRYLVSPTEASGASTGCLAPPSFGSGLGSGLGSGPGLGVTPAPGTGPG